MTRTDEQAQREVERERFTLYIVDAQAPWERVGLGLAWAREEAQGHDGRLTRVGPGASDEAELLASCCWQGVPPEALLSAAEELGLDVEPERCDAYALLLRLRDGECDGLGTVIGSIPGRGGESGYYPCCGCKACRAVDEEEALDAEREASS